MEVTGRGEGGREPGEERGRFLGRHGGQQRRWLRGRGPEVRGQVKQRTESHPGGGRPRGNLGSESLAAQDIPALGLSSRLTPPSTCRKSWARSLSPKPPREPHLQEDPRPQGTEATPQGTGMLAHPESCVYLPEGRSVSFFCPPCRSSCAQHALNKHPSTE